MDRRATKRIDSLYRNLKMLPTLAIVGVVVPIVGLVLLPIAAGYWYLRSRMLRDFAAGKFAAAGGPPLYGSGEVTPHDKLKYIADNGSNLVLPLGVGLMWLLPIVALGALFLFVTWV